MSLTPFPVEEFGGLRLDVDPTELGMGGAADLLNVDLDRPGRLRTRDGFTQVKSIASVTAAGGIATFHNPAGNVQEVAVGYDTAVGHTYAGFSLSGFVDTTTTTPGSSAITGSVLARSGGNDWLYISNGTDTIWRWAPGNAWSKPAGMPITDYLALQGEDFRLAAFVNSASSASGKARASFSDPGAPETWGATNWVDFPGEDWAGAVTFQNHVFAFQAARFFYFTGTSTLSDGSPVFNYVPVVGRGAIVAPAAGDEGVYFFDGRSILIVTANLSPVRVSAPVDAFLQGQATLGGYTIDSANLRSGTTLQYAIGRLYVRVPVTGGTLTALTLVFDPKLGAWTVFSNIGRWLATALGNSSYLLNQRPYLFWLTDAGKLMRGGDIALTDDAGTAIAWSYTTGYSSAGGYFRQRIVSSGERKKHFKTDILGSGAVTHQLLTLNGRPNDVADTGTAVTLGTAPALARGSRRRGARGTHFAHKLSGSGPAAVSGLTYWLSEISLDT